MPQAYLECLHTAPVPSNFYKPEMQEQLLAVRAVADKYAAIFDEHKNMPRRVQTVAMRLMRHYTDFCAGYADFMASKCMGKDDEAREKATAFLQEFGKRELALEHYYDHYMASASLLAIVNTKSEFDQ
jgi:ABC-type transport system involved in cytochrome bd biosynthesis fused ATPase/permease subunit